MHGFDRTFNNKKQNKTKQNKTGKKTGDAIHYMDAPISQKKNEKKKKSDNFGRACIFSLILGQLFFK